MRARQVWVNKLSLKPIWLAVFVLLAVFALALRLALAIPAFVPANQPVGWVAQDDLTDYNLTSGGQTVYRTQYAKEYWDGNLIAYVVNAAGDVASAAQPWNGGAAYQLELQGANRLIVTLRSDGAPIPFRWASLDAIQQGDLTGSHILDFLRGDRSGEVQQGGSLRQRASALGDMVHSRPYYLSDSASANPAPTVFVGANDGMLHAFNAVTGAERWAYVPSMLIPKMKNLALMPYVHDYYVDGSVAVASILGGSRRVLVGALGAGGKGLYALDISGSARLAPRTEAEAAANILWEITPTSINHAPSASYTNLGYSYANPSIVKVAGVDAVIVGNGYNNGGDYQAYLYLINANTGALMAALKAGSTGSVASPNGLSTPVAVDTDNDGSVDIVYAGDLNGTLWKFNLAAASVSALLTTSPTQPITMSPGVARHPDGGYMVNFATGSMFVAADMSDASVFAAYGVWDGAPTANSVLLTQTLTERCYTPGNALAATPCANRVRTVTSNQPNWTSGAGNHRGWRVALPAGERVLGDGSFIENGRFYFNGYNPTVANTVQASTVYGENWLMELDYLNGGSAGNGLPFLDLSGNHLLDSDDLVKFATPPALASDAIPVGKLVGMGVMSQPVLVQLSTLNTTLFSQNPDVTIVPVVLGTRAGVSGGHFDVDFFYARPSGGAQAAATITVGSNGQVSPFPATLGGIVVDGVSIVPALTVADIPLGTAAITNATSITNRVTGGFTATRSGTVISVRAPMGASYNGKPITVLPGSAQPLVPGHPARTQVTGVTGVAPSPGRLVITAVNRDRAISIRCGRAFVGSAAAFRSINHFTPSTRLNALYNSINATTFNGYATTCIRSPNTSVPSSLDCSITAPVGVSACAGGFMVDSDISTSTNTGPLGGVDEVSAVTASAAVLQSGWTDFAPALSVSGFNHAGLEPNSVGDSCSSTCAYKNHFHQYDDVFDVTGINLLNASSATLNLATAVPSLTQNFKLLVHNQYLNPAVRLHMGDPSYLYNLDHGYIPVKDYLTTATLDLASLQTYRRDPQAVWPGAATSEAARLALPKPIGSLAFNMPLSALTSRDWWGNGDVRVGLHPTRYNCVWAAAGANDGNMYQSVIPPPNGTDGPGVAGWSALTTPGSASGVRHNGALVIQVVRDSTPNSAIEPNVANRPEYGWRIKSDFYSNYVLAEWAVYWHHPNAKCYHSNGWTKTPSADHGASTPVAKAIGSTDPRLGDLSASAGTGAIVSVTVRVVGAVTTTTITYVDGSYASITRTAHADGTVTLVAVDALGVRSVQMLANPQGSLRTGGDERARQTARTGRVSWRELVAP